MVNAHPVPSATRNNVRNCTLLLRVSSDVSSDTATVGPPHVSDMARGNVQYILAFREKIEKHTAIKLS